MHYLYFDVFHLQYRFCYFVCVCFSFTYFIIHLSYISVFFFFFFFFSVFNMLLAVNRAPTMDKGFARTVLVSGLVY